MKTTFLQRSSDAYLGAMDSLRLKALTAATSGASAMRVCAPLSANDEKAAWITGEAMGYFAYVEESSFTPKAKSYLAILLGNSLVDVEDVATNSSVDRKSVV